MNRVVLLTGVLTLIAGPTVPLSTAAQEGVDWAGLMAGIAHGSAMDEAARASTSRKNQHGGERTSIIAPVGRLTYAPSIEWRRRNLAQCVAGAAVRRGALASSLDLAAMEFGRRSIRLIAPWIEE